MSDRDGWTWPCWPAVIDPDGELSREISMIKLALVATAAALMTSSALAAPALDAQGKCRDNGKFVAASLCKKPATPAATKCRDKTTKKFAKCSAPNTEPLPTK
jgi:hypothetical protein